jgi:hypothetical protein
MARCGLPSEHSSEDLNLVTRLPDHMLSLSHDLQVPRMFRTYRSVDFVFVFGSGLAQSVQ